MDFGELLHTAKKNEQTKPQIQYYSTKFAPPKKEQRAKTVSVNVQKFLARKEAEEKQKAQEALEKRNNLLALRSQDKKATRRVNVMLKRTKSANQAVIEDALDSNNTAVTLAGPSQPDEDDYGYVSQESSALYNKMMEKYSKMPDEPKFPQTKKKISTNLNNTKDRVKAALEKEREEALLPHRRKRKHMDSGGETEKHMDRNTEKSSDNNTEYEPEYERKDYSKPKFKPAPRVNFSDLLKLAEKKQFEPVVIEPKKEEEERPLTKKQKKEMEREKEWRERKESRNKSPQEKPPMANRIPKINESSAHPVDKSTKKVSFENPDTKKIPKVRESSDHQKLEKNVGIAKVDKVPSTSNIRKYPPHTSEMSKKCDVPQRLLNGVKHFVSKPAEKARVENKGSNQAPSIQKHRALIPSDKPKSTSLQELQRKVPIPDNKVNQKQSMPPNGLKTKPSPPHSLKSKQLPSNELKPKQFPPNDLKPKQLPPKDLKPKQFPPNDLRPKQFPPNDLRPKQFPPNDLRPKQFPPPDVRRNPKDGKRKPMANKRRIIDDDDEEYDPDMDDFIDDGPEEEQDYSKYINEIFGYDKHRYRFEDDDVDNMESTFAQQMKEEIISTKIGIMEDLEDIRQEEEAKKRKLLMKKKSKKL
ncbi:hypothetical protein Trydic_g7357 [Trypoxylus dichotomus]